METPDHRIASYDLAAQHAEQAEELLAKGSFRAAQVHATLALYWQQQSQFARVIGGAV